MANPPREIQPPAATDRADAESTLPVVLLRLSIVHGVGAEVAILGHEEADDVVSDLDNVAVRRDARARFKRRSPEP